MGGIGDCCLCVTREELPALISMGSAVNTIARADWSINECCATSTFHFDFPYTQYKSDVCKSRDMSLTDVVDFLGADPYYHPVNTNCATATLVVPTPVIYYTETTSRTDSYSTRVYLLARLKSIDNFVFKARFLCGGVESIKFVWMSVHAYEYKVGQYTESLYTYSCSSSPANPCFVSASNSSSISVTEAMIWASLGATLPDLSTGLFIGIKVYESLLFTGDEEFSIGLLGCEETPAAPSDYCLDLPTVAYGSFYFNSVNPGTVDTPYDDSVPTAILSGYGNWNIFPKTYGLPDYQPAGANALANYFAGPSCTSALTSSLCEFTGRLCGTPTGTTHRLSNVLIANYASRTSTFTSVPYSLKSAGFAILPWTISFS